MKTSFGTVIKEWRRKRGQSQLELAGATGISTKHLSFLETDRSKPSRQMVQYLVEALDVPLRDRNDVFLSAGFSPEYSVRMWDDPSLASAKQALEQIVNVHNPYPAFVIDKDWNLVFANAATGLLTNLVAPEVLAAPINVLKLALHPKGLAPYIVNFHEIKKYLLSRLDRDIALTQNEFLKQLRKEVAYYPERTDSNETNSELTEDSIVIPFKLKIDGKILSFMSLITVFGTPNDVVLSEVALETLFPLDKETLLFLQNR